MRTQKQTTIALLAVVLPTLSFSQNFEMKVGDQIKAQQDEVKAQVAALQAANQEQPDIFLIPKGPFKTDPTRYKAIVRELSLKAKDCQVNFLQMMISEGLNGPYLFKYADEMMRDYSGLERKLKDFGITLKFTYDSQIAGKCSLSRDSERFNFGSVEALRYVQSAVEVRRVKKGDRPIDELILEISPKTGEELYQMNLQAKPEIIDGKLVLKTMVNAGNESVGLAVIELSMKMFNNPIP